MSTLERREGRPIAKAAPPGRNQSDHAVPTVQPGGNKIEIAAVRESITRAKAHLLGFAAELCWQIERRAWEVIGYPTFDAFWDAEYAPLGIAVKREDRPELVSALREIGQTQQQIADKLGVSTQTVNNDLNSKIGNETETPTKITNSRGQQRPASYRKVKSERSSGSTPARSVSEPRVEVGPIYKRSVQIQIVRETTVELKNELSVHRLALQARDAERAGDDHWFMTARQALDDLVEYLRRMIAMVDEDPTARNAAFETQYERDDIGRLLREADESRTQELVGDDHG